MYYIESHSYLLLLIKKNLQTKMDDLLYLTLIALLMPLEFYNSDLIYIYTSSTLTYLPKSSSLKKYF